MIPNGGYEYETVYEGNLHLVEEYIEDVLQANANYVRNYFDLKSGEAHSMEISAKHDHSAFGHLDPAKLITLGTDFIRMIKNADGLTIGRNVDPVDRGNRRELKRHPSGCQEAPRQNLQESGSTRQNTTSQETDGSS